MNIKQEKILIASIVTILIILFTNIDSVSKIFEKDNYYIGFCESVEKDYGLAIVEAEKRYLGVPEYHNTIYIEPLKKEVLINNFAELSLKIIDGKWLAIYMF